jgi:ABC-2 type transport system permease protein
LSEPLATSSIYDLGYRRYDGRRVGRWATFLTLYVAGIRSAFGFGRRATSKIIPFTLAVFAFIPATIQVGIGAFTSRLDADIELFRHEDYFGYVQVVLILFCAAVAPELVGKDQRDRSISLYFSRAVVRPDYALAKLAALTSVMLVLTLGPQTVVFVGNGMVGDDLDGYISEKWDLLGPILAGSLFLSAAIASVGLVIAAYVPRRAYATAAIVGAFIVTLSVAGILMDTVDPSIARYALLVSPFDWEGAIYWFFGSRPDPGGAVDEADLPGAVYTAAGVATILVATALTVTRFRRLQP